MKTVPKGQFDMSYYGGRVPGCRTDGCAAGHAADIFRRQGYDCLDSMPTFQCRVGCEAVIAFFGIDASGYDFIFSSLNAPSTPKQVAKRIEDWVANYDTWYAKPDKEKVK